MSNYVNEALLADSTSANRKLKDESKALVNKWDKTGLLEDLSGDYNRSSMAILLENQARQLISEASKTQGGTAGTAGYEEWSGVALPLVRRIFAEIAAQDFVSVQPMNLPSGLVFFLDFKYGTALAGKSVGDSLAGKTGPNSPVGSSGTYPDGGFYGAGQYGYTAASASAAFTVTAVSAVPTIADLGYDSELSASNAGNLIKVTGTYTEAKGFPQDQQAARAARLLGSAGETLLSGTNNVISASFPALTVSASAGTSFIISGVAGTGKGWATSDAQMITYMVNTEEANRGDMEDSVSEPTATSIPIPEINLEMKSLPIVAKTRKLKAIWTPELAQDLNAYHSVDAEAELTAMLSEYISMEIDLEILDMLINDAITKDYWSAKVGYEWDGTSAFSANIHATNALAYTKSDWYQTLGQKIQKVSNKIHQLTLRGGANFVVCSPNVATIIESIEGFGASTDGNQSSFAMGVRKVGALSNRWDVYKNPYMTENTVLIGFRGSNFLETGAVYAPYVPLIMTPLVYDPVNFTPRKGVMTRYAKKMVRPEFYGKIQVHGLESV